MFSLENPDTDFPSETRSTRRGCSLSHTKIGKYQYRIQGGQEGHAPPPPGPVKISHEKMATKGGHIDFMLLGPSLPGC